MKYEDAIKFTRHNSGKHFLDSGGDNGRMWQRPNPSEDLIMFDDEDGMPTINLNQWLVNRTEFHDLHDEMTAIVEKTDDCYFEATENAMSELGYTQVTRDNIYNGDNDMSQVFIWEVYIPDWLADEYSDVSTYDWYYGDEVIIALYIHTGADVRGGYSPAMLVEFNEADGNIDTDWQCRYWDNENDNDIEGFYGLEDAGYTFKRMEDNEPVYEYEGEEVTLSISPC